MDRNTVPVFTHIFKTAGTTLNRIIEWQYLFKPGISYHAADLSYVDHFKALPQKKKENIKLIKGHFPFGIHEYVASPVAYFTMLREPVSRTISHYKDVLGLMRKEGIEISLKDFLEKGILPETDNCQVRFLSGNTGVPFGAVDEIHLQQAIHNLKTGYAVIGLAERFDESILLFAKQFGWNTVYYVPSNVSRVGTDAAMIDEDTQKLLDHYNRYDKILYQAAVDIFNEQVERLGAPFADEVSQFKKQNHQRRLISHITTFVARVMWWLNVRNLVSARFLARNLKQVKNAAR